MESSSIAGLILAGDRPRVGPIPGRFGKAGTASAPVPGEMFRLLEIPGDRRIEMGGMTGQEGSDELATLARLEAIVLSPGATIDGARMVDAPSMAGLDFGRASGSDPIASFLAQGPIRLFGLPTSGRSFGDDAAGPLTGLGVGLSPGQGGSPGPGDGDGPGDPADPGRPGGARIYMTASLRAVALILTGLGLLWWKLDRDGD